MNNLRDIILSILFKVHEKKALTADEIKNSIPKYVRDSIKDDKFQEELDILVKETRIIENIFETKKVYALSPPQFELLGLKMAIRLIDC